LNQQAGQGPGTAIPHDQKHSPWPHGQRLTGLMHDLRL